MDLFTYLLKKKGHNSSVNGDLFSYLLASRKRGTYQTYNGTQINVVDSINARMKNWILGGNTNQNGTPTPDVPIDIHNVVGENNILENEGKNLLNPASIDQRTRAGIKCTYNEVTQEITFDGTCTADNTGFYFLDEIVEAIKGVTTASVHYVSGSVTGYCNFRAFTQNYGGNINFNINDLSNDNKVDYVTSIYNEKLPRISFRFNEGSIADNLKVKVMIANTTNTEYEKYKGKNYKVSLSSRNLYNENLPLDNYYYDNNGNQASGFGSKYINEELQLSNTTLTISYKQRYRNAYVRLCEFQQDGTFIKRTLISNNNQSIMLNSLTAKVIFSVNADSDNFTDLQIELGNEATPYVPYMAPIELCKIGTYQDKIYKQNDKWLLEKNVTKITSNKLVDNATWLLWNSNIWYLQNASWKLQGIKQINQAVLCTHLKGDLSDVVYGNTILYDAAVNHLDLRFSKDLVEGDLSTETGLKNWLNTVNFTMYYVLETPSITEITDDNLINQLEELAKARSFENQTNITQLSEQLPFDLTVDIKTL